MKTLKFTLVLAILITTLSSCTKQDLNEDDLLDAPAPIVVVGGDGDIRPR
ncbi:hypothetical protein [Confluentibacter citreus]|nr:hypothetical protein [Confluentibacter citreus]